MMNRQLFPLLFTAGCIGNVGQDKGDNSSSEAQDETAPAVVITAPEESGVFYSDQEIGFAGEVSDDEDSGAHLQVSWESSLDGELGLGIELDADGRFEVLGTLSEGEHSLTLRATDRSGNTGSDQVTIEVGPPNSPPTCAITAPATDSADQEGTAIVFEATVDDVDVAEDWLDVTWSSDKDGELGTSIPASTGSVTFAYADLSVNTHVISMTVMDELGESCTDDILYSVGTPPSISIEAPISGDVVDEGELVSFQATVSDGEDTATDLTLSWTSDLDGEFSTQGSDSSGTVLFGESELSVGTHYITGKVTDTDGLYAEGVVLLQVNGLPTAPEVELSPDPAVTTDDLSVAITADATDADGDPITYTYAWSVDGVASSASTSATLSSADTTKGQTWTVEVTPNDGYSDGPAGSDSVTIDNTAPVLADVALTPDPATETDTLSCTPGTATDDDSDTVTYGYGWSVSGVDPGSTDSELTGDFFSKGDEVYCTVTPSDDEVSGDPVDSNTVTIDNTAPSIDSVSITPDPAVAADTLTCSYAGYADADGDADASTYEWRVNGSSISTDSTLEGAFVGGDIVVCWVTPDDGTDTGTASSDSITIENTAPVLDEVTLSPDPAYEGDILECTAGTSTDDDGESVSYSYAWSVDSTDPGETTDTLSSDYFDRDQEVFCTVTPNDGADDGDAVDSNSIVISNTAPEVTDVEISPSGATVNDELSCSYTFTDADSDADASTIEWDVDGTVVGSAATLSSGYVGGSVVTCTVTAQDGTDAGNREADSISIDNTAPVLADVTLGPDPAYEGDTLSCSPGSTTDDDGTTTFTYTYRWTVDGSDPGETTANLSSDHFDRDQTVRCHVTPNDGTDDGDQVASNAVTIENTAPSIDSVSVSPDPAMTSDSLSCSYSGWADVDGDADADTTYLWAINGTDVSTGTILSTGYVGGDTVNCTVTPDDGDAEGTALSTSIVIANTAPVLTDVDLSPEPAYEGDTLICTPGDVEDDDGTTGFTFSYAWTVDGSDPGETGATLSSSYFDRGQEVLCIITPNDGTDDGDAFSSNIVTISNTAPSIDSVSVSPSPATASDTLSCSYSGYTDVDDDSDASTLAWTVNGSSMGTDSTLEGVFVGGDVVACAVTPDDGTDTGTALSDSVTIENTAPVLSDVSLGPDPAYEDDTLFCSPGTTTDADGTTSFTYTYSWTVNGLDPGETSPQLEGDDFNRGDTVHCTVSPSDATHEGDAVDSNPVTISNTAPEVTSVVVDPDPATHRSELVCGWSFYDEDGDADESTLEWTIDGVSVGTHYILTEGFETGDEVVCTVTAHDGTDSGTSDSASVTIENTAPELTEVTLSPNTVYTDDTLTASASTDDAEGDEVSLRYDWYVDGTMVATGSAPTLSGVSYFDKDQEVYVVITPSDGIEEGDAVSSDSIIVDNTAPGAPIVSITPGAPVAGKDDLLCKVDTDSSDDDNDRITYTIAWEVDGVVYTDATSTTEPGDTVPAADMRGHEQWTCTVTPNDGDEDGDSVSVSVMATSCFEGWDSADNSLADASYIFIGEESEDYAGFSVSSAGDVDGDGLDDLIISAPNNEDGGPDAGKVYLILGASLGADTEIDLSDADYAFVSDSDQYVVGQVVSSAGDVDGDGLDDLIISAHTSEDGGAYAGKAYIVLGASLGVDAEVDLADADYALIGEAAWDMAGDPVASAGDVDGDGLDDILVGAYSSDDGGNEAGKTYLILGASLGVDAEIDLSDADYAFIGEAEYDLAGWSISSAGDMDGDGLDDILIGAKGSDWYTGKVYLILGASLGAYTEMDLSDADYAFIGEAEYDEAGVTVSTAGDVDGDGLDDILIGATQNDDGGWSAGKTYLILGASLGADTEFDLTEADYALIGEAEYDTAGLSVSSAGDVDGDGLDDILVGARYYEGSSAGKAFLMLGASLGTDTEINLADTDYAFLGETAYASAGYAISSAGDVDGNGLDDLLIGAPYHSGGSYDGKAYLLFAPNECTTRPRGTEVYIDPDYPIEAIDDLVCVIDTEAFDPDGDAITYTFEWEVDGVSYEDATSTTEPGDTVPAEDTFADEEWTCIVTPNDGEDDGASSETSVTVVTDAEIIAVFPSVSSWTDAQADCVDRGGALAWIESASVNSQVFDLCDASPERDMETCSIGLQSPFTVWENGDSVSYTNWKSGEPSGGSYTEIVNSTIGSGEWDATTPTNKPYICRFAGGGDYSDADSTAEIIE